MLKWCDFFPARWIVASATSLGGCFFVRAIVFIDGQNLYHLARRAWASPSSPYTWPSYDVEKLAHALVSKTPGRNLVEIRFYTGVPGPGRWRPAVVLARLLVKQDQVPEEPRDLRVSGQSERWGAGEGRRCQPRS